MSANRNVNEINMGEQTWIARTNDRETISSVIGTSNQNIHDHIIRMKRTDFCA